MTTQDDIEEALDGGWLTCAHCRKKVRPDDEEILGEAVFHRSRNCASHWMQDASMQASSDNLRRYRDTGYE